MKAPRPARRLFRFAAMRRKRRQSGRSRFGRALKHPVTLLVIGFLFTGVVGTILSAWVQNRYWRNQQDYTNQQNATGTKLEIMEMMLESTARALGANQDVVLVKDWGLDKEELDRRLKKWHRETARWHVEEKRIRASLQAHFRCVKVHDAFDDIAAQTDKLTVNVAHLVRHWDDKEGTEGYFNAVAQIRETFHGKKGKLNGLATLMLREIDDPASVNNDPACVAKAE